MKPKRAANILLAEDDYLVGNEIKRMIKKLGFQVAGIAPNGEKAIEMACSLQPDLVLMDIKMPKLDGLEACRQIREKCQIPAIVLTAYDSIDLVDEATDAGVLSYLVKPPKIDELERAIIVALARNKNFTDLRKVKTDLQKSLNEKETLLKEIHHRVKNNMTVISSLLNLQMNSIDNQIAKEALQDSQNRVQSMSMIHETLCRSDNLSAINLKTYLSELGVTIFQNYSISNKTRFKVEAENILIGAKQASPVGLIVNELITNCVKYAFPDDREGEILLELKSNGKNGVELIVSDNGVGLPEGFDPQNTNSLGLKLVKMLAENQLDGTIDMESNNGTKFIIKFNIEA
ncbi:response regulator [bacterium]|nr:response regulator [bacterium]